MAGSVYPTKPTLEKFLAAILYCTVHYCTVLYTTVLYILSNNGRWSGEKDGPGLEEVRNRNRAIIITKRSMMPENLRRSQPEIINYRLQTGNL